MSYVISHRSRKHRSSCLQISCRLQLTRKQESRNSSIVTTPSLRSEEHTSELQSQSNLVCRLLLEKKKKCRFHFLAARLRHLHRIIAAIRHSQVSHQYSFVRVRIRAHSSLSWWRDRSEHRLQLAII